MLRFLAAVLAASLVLPSPASAALVAPRLGRVAKAPARIAGAPGRVRTGAPAVLHALFAPLTAGGRSVAVEASRAAAAGRLAEARSAAPDAPASRSRTDRGDGAWSPALAAAGVPEAPAADALFDGRGWKDAVLLSESSPGGSGDPVRPASPKQQELFSKLRSGLTKKFGAGQDFKGVPDDRRVIVEPMLLEQGEEQMKAVLAEWREKYDFRVDEFYRPVRSARVDGNMIVIIAGSIPAGRVGDMRADPRLVELRGTPRLADGIGFYERPPYESPFRRLYRLVTEKDMVYGALLGALQGFLILPLALLFPLWALVTGAGPLTWVMGASLAVFGAMFMTGRDMKPTPNAAAALLQLPALLAAALLLSQGTWLIGVLLLAQAVSGFFAFRFFVKFPHSTGHVANKFLSSTELNTILSGYGAAPLAAYLAATDPVASAAMLLAAIVVQASMSFSLDTPMLLKPFVAYAPAEKIDYVAAARALRSSIAKTRARMISAGLFGLATAAGAVLLLAAKAFPIAIALGGAALFAAAYFAWSAFKMAREIRQLFRHVMAMDAGERMTLALEDAEPSAAAQDAPERAALARKLRPLAASVFKALRDRGAADEGLSPAVAREREALMTYVERFLADLEAGGRTQWTLNATKTHLRGELEPLLKALYLYGERDLDKSVFDFAAHAERGALKALRDALRR